MKSSVMMLIATATVVFGMTACGKKDKNNNNNTNVVGTQCAAGQVYTYQGCLAQNGCGVNEGYYNQNGQNSCLPAYQGYNTNNQWGVQCAIGLVPTPVGCLTPEQARYQDPNAYYAWKRYTRWDNPGWDRNDYDRWQRRGNYRWNSRTGIYVWWSY